MSADCIPSKTRTTLIKAIFDSVEMGRLLLQPGMRDIEPDLVYTFLSEAEDVLHDWSANI